MAIQLHELIQQNVTVWAEMTQSEHQHGGSGWGFGTCLWSPSRNASGNDRYAIMRQPRIGNLVLHFLEATWPDGISETRLCGISRVASSYTETSIEPPQAGNWAGRNTYYRIELSNFTEIQPTLPLREFSKTYSTEILAELGEDHPRHYPFAKYRDEVRTTQGIYLTHITPRLLRLIIDAFGIQQAALDTPLRPDASHLEFSEGQRLKREVFFFSRNPRLAAAAKAYHGLRCMACRFDFATTYGDLGDGYIECHHLNPLSERADSDWPKELVTSIEQVAVLCANCHRMIHRRRPALSIEDLRDLIRKP